MAVELELLAGLLATLPVRGGLPDRQWYALRPAIGPVRAPAEAFIAFLGTEAAREAVRQGVAPS